MTYEVQPGSPQPPEKSNFIARKIIGKLKKTEDTSIQNPYLNSRRKRILDISVGLTGLILTGPVTLSLTLVNKLLYRQQPFFYQSIRLGQDGREITIYKLCSLKEGSNPDIQDRIPDILTPFGKFLRRSCLDELPQLWNVVKGDLSLVGMRVLPQYSFDNLDRRLSPDIAQQFKDLYFAARPACTGLVQALGHGGLSISEQLRLYRLYAYCGSLGLDLRILLATPFAMLDLKRNK